MADYLGLIILLFLIGAAILAGTIGWVVYYLIPKAREISAASKADRDVLAYNSMAHNLIDCILNDKVTCGTLPSAIMDQVWELNGIHIDSPKGISR